MSPGASTSRGAGRLIVGALLCSSSVAVADPFLTPGAARLVAPVHAAFA